VSRTIAKHAACDFWARVNPGAKAAIKLAFDPNGLGMALADAGLAFAR